LRNLVICGFFLLWLQLQIYPYRIISSLEERSVTMLSELLVEETFFANLISTQTVFYVQIFFYPVWLNCDFSYTAKIVPTRIIYLAAWENLILAIF
jgi:hypothetical protein